MAALVKCMGSMLNASACFLNSASLQWSIPSTTRILAGFTQTRYTRHNRKVKRRKTHPFIWWPQKENKFMIEELTKENQEFLKDYVSDQYPNSGLKKDSPLKEPPWPRGEWAPKSKRTGVIARKIGIYPIWTKEGKKITATLLQVLDNHVIRYHPPEQYILDKFGKKYEGRYGCLVVGADAADPQLFTSSYNGLFEESGVQTKRKLTKFLITPNAAIQPGTPLSATHFRVGDYVDIYGVTIDHGFQGVVKRWGFKGGPASHGCTKSHRRPGNIGGGRDVGRVWPGKKLPGHMGSERRYLRGLKILRINTKDNVIYVRGPAVPGAVHSYVNILDTVLPHRLPQDPPHFPTLFLDDIKEPLAEEYFDKEIHNFSDPTITYPEDIKTKKVVIKRTGAKTAAKRQ